MHTAHLHTPSGATFQVWDEGELKLAASLFPSLSLLFPFRRTHSTTAELGLMDVWGLLSRPSGRSFNLPTHVLRRGGRSREDDDL